MTARQRTELTGANHARHAIQATRDALAPLLHRMPEGGLVGQALAVLQDCERQLNAALREMDGEDDDRTPLPTSASQQFRAVTVERIFEEAKGKR